MSAFSIAVVEAQLGRGIRTGEASCFGTEFSGSFLKGVSTINNVPAPPFVHAG